MAINGWDDKRSIFNAKYAEHGKIEKLTGQYWLNDIQINFSLTRQLNGEYIMRGQCSLISPQDGFVLQVQGKERRKRLKKLNEKGVTYDEGRLEELNASASLYSRSDDLDTLKCIIAKKAEKLYGDNILSVEESIKRTGPAQNIRSAQAVRIYADKFLTKSNASTKTIRSYKNALVRIGGALDSTPMNSVKIKDIRKLAESLGNSADATLLLAQRFWAYCRDIGLFKGCNPFDEFFSRHKLGKEKSADILQRNAVTPKVLPYTVEATLNERIMNNLSDGRMLGLAIIKGAGLPSSAVCSLNWGDIHFDNEDYQYVRIKIRKDDLAGSTHDFTHPIFPFEGQVLHRRYDLLREKYSLDKLLSLPVTTVLKNEKKPLSAKDVTAFCRTELLQSGIGHSALSTPNIVPGGIGVRLLQSNYVHKIVNECGLQNDIASVKFLQCHSLLGDVTANNYRSFICPEGQRRLYCAMYRDRRFQPPTDAEDCLHRVIMPDGSEKITILSPVPQRMSSSVIRVRLKPGENIRITAPCGVQGTLSANGITSSIDQISFQDWD